MNSKKFSAWLGLVFALAILVSTGGQPRPALSAAPPQQGDGYVMAVTIDPSSPCPEQFSLIVVSVSTNPDEIDRDHPERNKPPSGVIVFATVSEGTLEGRSGSGKAVVGQTNSLGFVSFLYRAPARKARAATELLKTLAEWIEPWSGQEIRLEKTDVFPLARCSYKLWIADKGPIMNVVALGVGKAQVDDDGKLAGDGTLDIYGSTAFEDCRQEGHASHRITVKGKVSGETAKFELEFSVTKSELTTTCSEGSKKISAWFREIPKASFEVDAFRGGKATGFLRTFVDVVREYKGK